MKKALLIVLLILSSLYIIGCDSKPSSLDPTTKGWELFASGTIKNKRLEMNSYNQRVFVVELEDGFKIDDAERFPNWDEIQIGQIGKIYKWDSTTDTYIWEPSDGSSIIIAKAKEEAKEEIKEEEEEKEETPIVVAKAIPVATENPKEKWVNLRTIKPVYGQIVLVRLDDGIITTAYVDHREEWKLSSNKSKMSGGISINNVKEWKKIDLD